MLAERVKAVAEHQQSAVPKDYQEALVGVILVENSHDTLAHLRNFYFRKSGIVRRRDPSTPE